MKKTKYILIAVGLLIFGVLVAAFGLETTINHLVNMGSGFWLIVLLYLISSIILTWGWRMLIAQKISFKQLCILLLARIAGDSASAVNPIGGVAGEALKALYVKDFIPIKAGLASVVLVRTAHSTANMMIMLTGIIVSMFALNLPVIMTVSTLALILTSFAGLIFLMNKQKSGFLAYLISLFPEKWAEKIITPKRRERIESLDKEISYIFTDKTRLQKFYVTIILHYIVILITGTLEIYLIIKLINPAGTFTAIQGIFVYIFGFILTSAAFFMPANMGTSEGSYALALELLGLDASMGISVGFIRRLRTFFWAGIGMLLLLYAGFLKKDISTELEQ